MAGSLVTRGRDLLHRKDPTLALTDRVRALREAADACEGRVSTEVVDEAYRVSLQVDTRLALSGGATVVALAGATGSGKSSTFNALTGTDLATVGVRRPTTSVSMAATWGEDAGEELLDWLQVRRRHVVDAHAAPGRGVALDGLVLLDLPDHDSTAAEHRTEVDRLVALVDVLVWVVDPQKYADAALHERYLRPLAGHAAVMLVVLNQVDTLSPDARAACLRDLRRLLDAEGLGGVEVIGVSAVTGEGLDTLLTRLARVVAGKRAAAARLAADVGNAAAKLESASGTDPAPELSRRTVATLDTQLGEAAGVPVVTQAVDQAWRLRGGLATGWPVLAWVAKFKPDPLRRLRLGSSRGRKEIASPTSTSRTSLPGRSGVQQARVDTALRTLADEASDGLRRGWSDAVRATTRRSAAGLSDSLDRAVATTDLDVDRHRRWWSAVRVLQWVLVAGVLVGLGWLGAAFLLAYLQLPPLPKVAWWGFPAPTVLTIGGVAAGLLVAALARIGVVIGARRRARLARQRLLAAVSRVSADQVVTPVRAELERYETARSAILRARG
ncbi:GTPase [Microlunatus antarcticus]|uniref:GTP-binding protein EngB required for normal cell division n=1 Tax=Microlunatus antarcticus TaxID=53388 RepID=A0A7W5JTG1_9ACTN|nr:GTPase [Microlunatus antarcticus]MBB3325915.1 GTP-binding protein EngB required for normal cell division [Microlunatus antarcticus]